MSQQPAFMAQTRDDALVIRTLPAFAAFSALLLTLALLALTLSTVAGFELGLRQFHSNLFTAYEKIWPGQSITSVAEYARQTPDGFLPCTSGMSPTREYPGLTVGVAFGAFDVLGQKIVCSKKSIDGPFRLVTLAVVGGQVQQVELFSDVLQRDTLFLYWGAPDALKSEEKTGLLALQWDRRSYQATALVTEQTAIVGRITLTAKT